MTYTTGFIVQNNLTRAPYGTGGIPLAIQERDPRSGQPMNVTASVNNMGFIRHAKYDGYTFRISATDMNFDVYLDPINDAIEQFDNHTQFMILSVPDTSIGFTGWMGIGQLAAWPCLNYTIPDWENRYYHDFIGNPTWDMFLYFLCIDREYFDHEFDDYYINNTNITFGIGEYMFVVESTCPHQSHSESHSHSQSHNSQSESKSYPSQSSTNLLPTWAFYLIIIGCPILSILLIACAFYGVKGARTRQRGNSIGRESLLPQTETQGHAQKQGAVSSSSAPVTHSAQEYAQVSKKSSYYYNKTN